MIDRSFNPRFRCCAERGAALIITLCFVVLLAVLVVVFLGRSMAQRKVEAAGAGAQQAELLARDVARVVLDDLRKEVEAGSEAFATNRYYRPKAAGAMLPSRVLMPAISGAAATAPGGPFHRLFKQSGAERFFPASVPYETAPVPLLHFATNVSSLTPALGGAQLSPERWNAPRLITGNGFQNADEVPRWVYVDRDLGPADVAQAHTNLTGRFAFNLYEVGGTLDLNALGAANDVLVAKVMGSVGGVEPRWLGNGAAVSELLKWRDRATSTSEAVFLDYLRRIGPGQGFLQTPAGDRRLMTRRDLILALEGRFAGLSGILPYVGHYSREVAGPGIRTGAISAENPQPIGVRHPVAKVLTTYRPDGQAVTYEAAADSPLMPSRFPLGRLQWLTHAGPLTPGHVDAIRACFGLSWNATDYRWDYVGSDGGPIVRDRILTLAEVAIQGREPNFFEVLKAAIDTGSLGQAATQATLNPSQATYDASKDLHILRIGANIIDCGDEDNYPTRIAFSTNGTVHTISGIEDLPYLWGAFPIAMVAYGDLISTNPLKYPRYRADIVLTPHLFNPHQLSASAPAASPTHLRIRLEGSLNRVQLRADQGSGSYYNYTTPTDLSSRPAVEIPIDTASFRAFPDIPKAELSSVATARYAALLPHFKDTGMGFVLHSVVHTPPLEAEGTSTSPANIWLEGVNLTLEYQDGTRWVPYDRLTGVEGLSGGVAKPAADTFNMMNVGSRVVHASGPGGFTQSFNNDNLTRSYLPKADPRTTRFSLSWNPSANYGGGVNGPANQMPAATVCFQTAPPFAGWGATQLLQLPEGGLSIGANPGQIADPDSIVRPADGYRGATGNPLRSGSYPTARPVILQRPYQSVAELGYVFRDLPWKTLDLSSPLSADAALLEYFCVGESVPENLGGEVMNPPLMAGKVNLNAAPPPVLSALLGSALRDDGTLTTRLSATEAEAVAALLADPDKEDRLTSLAGLTSWSAHAAGILSAEHQVAKRATEQITRGLASAGQVRTWNLMLDVIAQSGKFPPAKAGGTLGDFAVEGESRFWVFIALDRLTGEVVDVRFESPYE